MQIWCYGRPCNVYANIAQRESAEINNSHVEGRTPRSRSPRDTMASALFFISVSLSEVSYANQAFQPSGGKGKRGCARTELAQHIAATNRSDIESTFDRRLSHLLIAFIDASIDWLSARRLNL